MSRRTDLAALIPEILQEHHGLPVHINLIYKQVEVQRPDLVDDEPDPYAPKRLKWKHDVRWELQSGVTNGRILKREDVGRGYYSSAGESSSGEPVRDTSQEDDSGVEVRIAPIEQIHREEPSLRKAIAPREILRSEAKLVQRYEKWLAPQGISVGRIEFRLPGDRRFVADVYDSHRNLLIEAKAQTQRADIRMAVGQLFDYAYLLGTGPSLAVLLPGAPSRDIGSMLASCRIGSISEASAGEFVEALAS